MPLTLDRSGLDQAIISHAFARIARIDPPRHEPVVKLRVTSRPDFHVECGKKLRHGENVIDVYQSQVRVFTDQVDMTPEDEKAMAVRMYQRSLAKWVTGEGDRPARPEAEYPYSVAHFLREITQEERPPFDRVELLGVIGPDGKLIPIDADVRAELGADLPPNVTQRPGAEGTEAGGEGTEGGGEAPAAPVPQDVPPGALEEGSDAAEPAPAGRRRRRS